jgi:hypothetical protein
MNQEPRDDERQESTHNEKPRRAFILTENTIVYEAEPNDSENERQSQPTVINVQSHLPVELKSSFRDKIFKWVEVLLAAVTFIVVTYYTKAAFIQATAAIQSADAAVIAANTNQQSLQFARDSFHISERPYVTVSSINFDAAPEENKETGLTIIADNSGHTPALKVIFSGAAFLNEKIIGGKFVVLKNESVIPSQHQGKSHYTLTFSSSDLNEVVSKSAFKFKGTIRYTDIFDELHPTTFCMVYDSKEKLFKFCSSDNEVK